MRGAGDKKKQNASSPIIVEPRMPPIDSRGKNSQSRLDARLKMTGEARYTADLELPSAGGRLPQAAFVQSQVSSGVLVEIDDSAALAAPGFIAVMTWQNAPRLKEVTTLMSTELDRLLPLQKPDICYKGQAIAVVISDTLLHAQFAASLVVAKVDGKGKQPKLSFEAEIPNAPEAKKVGAGEYGTLKRGRPEAAFDQAQVQLDRTYATSATH